MEALANQAGWFWLPSDSETRWPGTLNFDAESGGELALHPRTEDGGHMLEHDSQKHRVVGSIGDDVVTLEGCFPRSTSFFGGEQRLSVDMVIKGALFGHDEALTFDAVSFDVDNAIQWIETSAVTHDIAHGDDGGIESITMTLRPIPTQTEVTDFGSVSVFFGWQTKGPVLTEARFKETRAFKLSFEEPAALDVVLRRCRAVQDLVTLAVDAPCLTRSMSLYRDDVRYEHGRQERLPIELLTKNRSHHKALAKPREAYEMLFKFSQLGGVAGLATWFAVADSYRTALDSLLSLQYGNGLYLENRLQNAVHAAETLHRMKFPNEVRPHAEFKTFKKDLVNHVPKESREWLHAQLQYANEPRLAQRLRDLAEHAGPVGLELVGDSAQWGKRVADMRNSLVHHPKQQAASVPTRAMYYLAESVYWVLLLCLIREGGYGDAVTSNISQHRQFKWVKDHLTEPDVRSV
jgi:hypothetical protein